MSSRRVPPRRTSSLGSVLGFTGEAPLDAPPAEAEAGRRSAPERERADAELAQLAREKEARAAAELANQRLALLAEVSAILSSSLDPGSTMGQIARLMVRQFVDCCWIELLERDQPAQGIAVAHRDPDKESALGEIRRCYPSALGEPPSLSDVAGSRAVQLCTWPDEAFLRQLAADDAHLERLRQVAPDVVLLVPMAARGQVFGVISFGRYGRPFSADDRSFCDDLAQRAAASVDNARAYRSERAARLSAESIASTLTRLQEITSSLSGALTPTQVAEVVVREGVATLRGASGVVLVLSADGDALEMVSHNGLPADVVAPYVRVGLDEQVPVVRAYTRRAPEMIETLDEFCVRYPHIAERTTPITGTRALFCLPLLLDGKAIGVFGVTFVEDRRLSAEEHAFVTTLARQCAQALDRARLYEAELRTNGYLRLLAQAGDVLSSSLDAETTLRNLASLSIPMLGDLCFFDMVEGREARRLAYTHDEASEDHLCEVPWESRPGEEILAAFDAEQSGFYPDADERALERLGSSPEHLARLRSLGICSMITVPMVALQETLGVITLCFSSSGRHHTAIDLVLAEELARRATTAIENARLHRASQEATRRAQEATRLSEHANRAKDEFLGVVSHELRTPLNAILGWAQLLSGDRVRDPAVFQKGITVIERNARAQVKLIEDLLDVSRIISGKLRIDLRPMDLEPVIRASVEVVRPAADAKGVELVVSAEPGVIVSGDPDRLQQVVWNLLANAVKFTPKAGVVQIVLALEEPRACIRVRDSGKGIDAAFLPYVFERFRQADSSTTRRHGGLGLGLAIVRHVVELHGGSVRAESEGMDAGSVFTVELPMRAESVPERDAAPRAALESDPGFPIIRLDGLKVLVVDDEFDAREMIATLLQVCGAQVAVVASAAEALARLATFAADVLVSDVGMPGDDGYALIRKVRASGERYAQIPALALTAYAASEDARQAVLAGFQAHLSKPAEPAVLTALVASLGARGKALITQQGAGLNSEAGLTRSQ